MQRLFGLSCHHQTAKHLVAQQATRLLAEQLRAWHTEVTGAPLDRPGSDGAGEQADDALAARLPELAAEYAAARTTKMRIKAILNGYPSRMDPQPDGYNPDDLVQSLSNFLSIGIKVGTDAYKSNTAPLEFIREADRLQSLMRKAPGGSRSVPYGKSTAREMKAGTFNAAETLASLKENPTLGGAVMETSMAPPQPP